MKLRKYRVNRDWFYTSGGWQVEVWRLWWPFWVEERGLLRSKEEALERIKMLEGQHSTNSEYERGVRDALRVMNEWKYCGDAEPDVLALLDAPAPVETSAGVTVQEAAKVLLDASRHTSKPLKAGAMIDHIHFGPTAIAALLALSEGAHDRGEKYDG